jgi:alpha-glucosidase
MLNFQRRFIALRRTMPQLTRGEIAFIDAPEPVLALRRDLAGERSVLAAFNLSNDDVTFDWPATEGADHLTVAGLAGEAQGGRLTLPPYGAWFGLVRAEG